MLSFRHARKHFSQAEGSQLDEVRQVMGMLAFPPDTHISPYKVTGACGPSGLMGLSVATSTLSVTSTPSRPFPILICFAGKKFGSENTQSVSVPRAQGLSSRACLLPSLAPALRAHASGVPCLSCWSSSSPSPRQDCWACPVPSGAPAPVPAGPREACAGAWAHSTAGQPMVCRSSSLRRLGFGPHFEAWGIPAHQSRLWSLLPGLETCSCV